MLSSDGTILAAETGHSGPSHFLRGVGQALAGLGKAAAVGFSAFANLPPNWVGLRVDEMVQTVELMRRTGLCLIGVPSPTVIRELLAAPSKAERDGILLASEDDIIEGLRELVPVIAAEPALAKYAGVVAEVLDAHAAGFHASAQALAGSLLTALLTEGEGVRRLGAARRALLNLDTELYLLRLRGKLVRETLALVLSEFWPGDSIPGSFNRHATAHTVSPAQFNRANGLEALMATLAYARELVADARIRRGDISPPWPISEAPPMPLGVADA